MSRLTSRRRRELPKSDFGEPGKKAYPMPDKAHARDAKARASEEENKGKLSAGEKAKIDAKADKMLGESKGKTKDKKKVDEKKLPKKAAK